MSIATEIIKDYTLARIKFLSLFKHLACLAMINDMLSDLSLAQSCNLIVFSNFLIQVHAQTTLMLKFYQGGQYDNTI